MRKFIIPVIAITALLFFSCDKKDNARTGAGTASDGRLDNAASGTALDPGYVLRIDAGFYTLEADTGSESDKTKWAASMSLGEKVSVGKDRRLTFHGDGKVYLFTEVRRDDGKEGWAWASQVASNCELATVIGAKATLCKSADIVDVTSQMISRKTVVALFPETEKNGFVKIKAYDPYVDAPKSYVQNFLHLDNLSRKESDVRASILLQIAEPLKNEGTDKVRKDALLEELRSKFSNSVFRYEIMELVNPDAYFNSMNEID